ncbi:MAG TPA: GNAT family protein [Candidatus Propionivibrio aalborgensis]|nr:GNAT family protein [Candidatus Propionivibrio aalborgensis]
MSNVTTLQDDPRQHGDGGRIYLRKLVPDDVGEAYLGWFRDPIVTEYLDSRNLSREDVVSYMTEGHASGLHAMYGIFVAGTDQHIGNVKVGPIAWKHGTGGLVTFIGERDFWGKGIAREAVRIGTRLAFDIHGLRKLHDGVADGNIGSLKAYQAAGWIVEARMRGQHIVNDNVRDRIVISAFNPRYFPPE